MTFSFFQHSCLGKKMSPLKFAESHNKGKHFLKVINKSIHLSYTNCPAGPKGCAGSTILMFKMNPVGSMCLT